MAKGGSSPLDAQKTLFGCLDISCTVRACACVNFINTCHENNAVTECGDEK